MTPVPGQFPCHRERQPLESMQMEMRLVVADDERGALALERPLERHAPVCRPGHRVVTIEGDAVFARDSRPCERRHEPAGGLGIEPPNRPRPLLQCLRIDDFGHDLLL